MKYIKYFESYETNHDIFNYVINILDIIGIKAVYDSGSYSRREEIKIPLRIYTFDKGIITDLLSVFLNKNQVNFNRHSYKEIAKFVFPKKHGYLDDPDSCYIRSDYKGKDLYKNLIDKIIKLFEEVSHVKQDNNEIDATFIKNIIIRYLNKIKNISLKQNINFDFIYDIIVDEVRNIHQSGKIFNSIKKNNPDLYNKLKIVADREGIDLEGSNKMDDIGFNDNYKFNDPNKQYKIFALIVGLLNKIGIPFILCC